MRWLARAALGTALLAALALGALALLLPRLIASDAARARIESAAEAALGRELRYRNLDVGLLPPSLVVVGPVVAGERPGAPPFAEARSVSLRVALLPLLARTLLIDGLVVEGATLRLRRGRAGLELPGSSERGSAPRASADAESADGGASLGVRGLELRDATLILEDAAVVPPVIWELRGLQAELRGQSPAAPLRVAADFELASGGRAAVRGTATLGGEVDLAFTLDGVSLASAAPYVEAGARLAGRVSGTLELEGPARSPTRISARLALSDGDVELDEIALRGPLRIEADLAGGLEAPSGRFDVDATQAELVYGGAFRKPAGTSATVSGRLVSGPGGVLGVDDVKLRVRNLDATATLRRARRTRVELRAPAFDLTAWEALFPTLARWRLGGRLAFDEITLTTSPREVRGRVGLDGVAATLPGGGTLVLRGVLVGEGTRVHGDGLEVVAADQPFRADAELAGLSAAAPRLRLRFEGREADVDRLLTAFAGRRGALQGRLALSGDLGLPLAAGHDPLAAVGGRVRLEIRDGRVAGRSLLQSSLAALTAVSRGLDQLAGGWLLGGGRSVADDRFESIAGTFDVAEGVARTDDLRVSYRDHVIDLVGTLRLADLALDMTGSLAFGTGAGSASGDVREGGSAGVRRRISLAHVRGTLGQPRVEITPDAVRSFAAALTQSRLGTTLDRAVGSDAARGLVESLEGLLRKPAPERR